MDLATLIGFVLICVGVFGGNIMEGGNPIHLFTHPAPIMIVVLAALGATVMSFRMPDAVASVKWGLKTLLPGGSPNMAQTAATLVELAGIARKEGVLALERQTSSIEDEFMARALTMAVDGTDAEVIRDVLDADIAARKQRHKAGAKFFTTAGIFAPTFGIIGAVLGLIHTLGALDDPSGVGAGIAAAFVATFWGVFSANGIFLPMGNKLTRLSETEVAHDELVIEGILAIQAGNSPRLVAEMLNSYLPPAQRAESK